MSSYSYSNNNTNSEISAGHSLLSPPYIQMQHQHTHLQQNQQNMLVNEFHRQQQQQQKQQQKVFNQNSHNSASSFSISNPVVLYQQQQQKILQQQQLYYQHNQFLPMTNPTTNPHHQLVSPAQYYAQPAVANLQQHNELIVKSWRELNRNKIFFKPY